MSVSAREAADHLLLGVANRDAGVRWVEERTGVRAVIGGSHPGIGTHNALLSLGGRQYLEIIAVDPDQTAVADRYHILKTLEAPRLITWAAVSDDIDVTATQWRAAGLDVAGPKPGGRQRPDGTMMRWATLDVKTDLAIVIPFLIAWERGMTHPAADSPQGCRLETLTFAHPQPARVRDTLARMGIDAVVDAAPDAALIARLQTPRGALELR